MQLFQRARRNLLAPLADQQIERRRANHAAQCTFRHRLQGQFRIVHLETVFHRVGAPILHDHVDVNVLLVSRQHLSAKAVIVDLVDINDVDDFNGKRPVPSQAGHCCLRVRAEALLHTAFRFVDAVQSGQRPGKYEQHGKYVTAGSAGCRFAAATADDAAQFALPVLHNLVQVIRFFTLFLPGILTVSIIIPGHVSISVSLRYPAPWPAIHAKLRRAAFRAS